MGKKVVSLIMAAVLAVSLFTVFTACASTVDEPCMYCDERPSREYQKSDGTMVYICEDCSSECWFCGERATKSYESMIGFVFVCDDCYESAT